jgi:hypothetical protein
MVERVHANVLMFQFIVNSMQKERELDRRVLPIERPILINSDTRGLHQIITTYQKSCLASSSLITAHLFGEKIHISFSTNTFSLKIKVLDTF